MPLSKTSTPATAGTVNRGLSVDCPRRTSKDGDHQVCIQLTIVVAPIANKAGYFSARIDGDRTLLCRSRTPLLDSARILLARGYAPSLVLHMRHDGVGESALWASLEVAAALMVEDSGRGTVFRRFRTPSRGAVGAPCIVSGQKAAISVATCVSRHISGRRRHRVSTEGARGYNT